MKMHVHSKRPARTVAVVYTELAVAVKVLLFFVALFFAVQASAQNPCVAVDNGLIIGPESHGATKMRKPVPYPHVREADVIWAQRIWRTLDLREKMNHPYYYPEVPNGGLMSLFDIIKGSVLGGCVTAFDNPVLDDEFKVKMTAEQVSNLLISKDVVDVEDPFNPGTYRRDTIVTEIQSSDVLAYWIKEDWFFDKQRSVMDVRILGICPLVAKKDPNSGEAIGYRPLFWIYFPQLRPVLVRHEVYIGQNFAQRLSYDDIFTKRFFASYIHKQSNVYDRSVSSYLTGLDALLESEAIKENIMNFEHDLWHF